MVVVSYFSLAVNMHCTRGGLALVLYLNIIFHFQKLKQELHSKFTHSSTVSGILLDRRNMTIMDQKRMNTAVIYGPAMLYF